MQAITWPNADLLLTRPFGKKSSEKTVDNYDDNKQNILHVSQIKHNKLLEKKSQSNWPGLSLTRYGLVTPNGNTLAQ